MKTKNIDIMQLIGSLALFAGCTINFIKNFVEIPLALSLSTIPLLLIAIVFYTIALVNRLKKNKKKDK